MFISDLRKEKRLLQKEIQLNDRELSGLPDCDFHCTVNRGRFTKWYTDVNGQRKYLRKKERAFANKLARRKYLQLLNDDLQCEIEYIDSMIEHLLHGRKSAKLLNNKLYADLSMASSSSAVISTLDDSLQEWQSQTFNSNPRNPEALKHPTEANVSVRSKSEALIVSSLLRNNIPFHYEEELIINDFIFYPDFTILHPVTGELIYWEHLGLMDDAGYRAKAINKLDIYGKAGIYPGINLIITCETKENPLTLVEIDNVIQHYLT